VPWPNSVRGPSPSGFRRRCRPRCSGRRRGRAWRSVDTLRRGRVVASTAARRRPRGRPHQAHTLKRTLLLRRPPPRAGGAQAGPGGRGGHRAVCLRPTGLSLVCVRTRARRRGLRARSRRARRRCVSGDQCECDIPRVYVPESHAFELLFLLFLPQQ